MSELGWLTSAHHEFGDEVDIPVAIGAVVFGGLHTGAEHLPEIRDVEGSALPAVVLVAVDVEHVLALLSQQPRQDRFLDPCAHHDHVVLLVHRYTI